MDKKRTNVIIITIIISIIVLGGVFLIFRQHDNLPYYASWTITYDDS